jgi:hypothetical protein
MEMKSIKDDSDIFEQRRLNVKLMNHIDDLTATEKLALANYGVFIQRDPETGKNYVV